MSPTPPPDPSSEKSPLGRPLLAAVAAIGVGYLTFCIATFIFLLATQGGALDALASTLLMPLLALFVGPVVGLVSTAPYFSAGFKLTLLLALVGILGLFLVGIRFRLAFWGKLLAIGTVWLWILAGLVGFGPQ